MQETILQASGLTKRYGEFVAVDDLSFEIRQGETFSLLGPNGAGKSTTIGMLCCLLRPTSGDATIAGHSILNSPQGVKETIGFVPQDLALYQSLNARQNLAFWGAMYGMRGTDLHKRIDEVLEQVNLLDRAKERVETYSGGMKRRLNIAVGLLHRPKLLFMDEPTVGIDPQSRRRILDMVKELIGQGMTVLYTTHYMEEAEELSDRVGIVDHGKLIALGTQSELKRLVGEHDQLLLSFDEGAETAELAMALREIDQVVGAAAVENGVAVTVANSAEMLPHLITVSGNHNLHLRAIEISEPNLESVFLHLTGRALRE
jgi:ABC-2 type transport system ATP-binding protein